MSDNNFPCGECGGSGVVCTFHSGPVCDQISEGCECEYSQQAMALKLHHVDKCENEEPCPSCSKGRVQLALECGYCYFGIEMVNDHNEEIKCGKCNDDGYRPLTDSEVRELINNLKPTGTTQYDPIELLMANIERGEQEFKGSQVVLIPTTN